MPFRGTDVLAVVVCDIDQERIERAERELTGAGVDCRSVVCDITDRESVAGLFASAAHMGPVSSVVHTAGASPSMGSAEAILRINALGTMLVARAFYEIAGEGAALVNVASVAGHQLPRILAPRRRDKRSFHDPERLDAELQSICRRLPRSIGRAEALWPAGRDR